LSIIQVHLLHSRLDDSQVRLMWDIKLQVLGLEPVFRQKLLRNVGHAPDGEFEDVPAILMDIMHFVFNGFRRRRMKTSTRGHVQELPTVAVTAQDEIDDSALAVLTRLNEHGPGAVPEQNTGRPIVEINNRCQDRKSTRLNSSHVSISYAVFCLK